MDKTVMFHPFDGAERLILAQTGYVKSVCPAVIGNNSVVLTGGDDEDIWVWDVSSSLSQPAAKVQGHCGEISAIQLVHESNQEGYVVITASLDGTLRRWSVQGKTLARDIADPQKLCILRPLSTRREKKRPR
jgi:WD40 repeat protein